MAEWHRDNVEELHLPELYDIDGVVTVFKEAGFDAVRFADARPIRRHHQNA
jgi:hypothetical protein